MSRLFAMELMPRITRAQSMDALSSMATSGRLSGGDPRSAHPPQDVPDADDRRRHNCACEGLRAWCRCRRTYRRSPPPSGWEQLCAAYDVRPAVKEQVESVGGKFVMLDIRSGESEDKGGYAKAMDEEFYKRQRALLTEVIREQDVVITTAAVPGQKAPILVTAEMADGDVARIRHCRHRRRTGRQLRVDAPG